MATAKAVVIREAIGDYRIGNILLGDEMKAFLKGKPNPDYYHVTRVEVDTPEQSELPETPPVPTPVVKPATVVKGS